MGTVDGFTECEVRPGKSANVAALTPPIEGVCGFNVNPLASELAAEGR